MELLRVRKLLVFASVAFQVSGFWWPIIENIQQKKFFFWSETSWFHKGRPSYRRSLLPSKENI
jgi:hypothetical protein